MTGIIRCLESGQKSMLLFYVSFSSYSLRFPPKVEFLLNVLKRISSCTLDLICQPAIFPSAYVIFSFSFSLTVPDQTIICVWTNSAHSFFLSFLPLVFYMRCWEKTYKVRALIVTPNGNILSHWRLFSQTTWSTSFADFSSWTWHHHHKMQEGINWARALCGSAPSRRGCLTSCLMTCILTLLSGLKSMQRHTISTITCKHSTLDMAASAQLRVFKFPGSWD